MWAKWNDSAKDRYLNFESKILNQIMNLAPIQFFENPGQKFPGHKIILYGCMISLKELIWTNPWLEKIFYGTKVFNKPSGSLWKKTKEDGHMMIG